ncbi:MAG: hypothetical protein EON84_16655 [Bradyrhizobiaceae bacterium]|nr:MAG: hypothetical protein EON84_16655 [Bradyrhizobiaceae bacterium]
MSEDFSGLCSGGPKDGEQLTAPSDRVPMLAPGSDTEGQLLGFYVHARDNWEWQPEKQPDELDRLR